MSIVVGCIRYWISDKDKRIKKIKLEFTLFCKFAVMELPSKLLENAVNEVAQLPGIGKRTALRLVLHLLRQPESQTQT
jgi:Holliday junction resolvasome RuvABC DNA-binding subunit